MPTELHHRLPSADAAWLHMDRPTNLMVINSVMLFEERVDEARLREVIRERLVERYPRFHARVVESRLPLLGPSFEDDPHFDLDRHLHRLGLPAPADEAALRELVGDLIASPLDHAKPLWDMYMIDRPGGGCALIVRMHHCIADGIALARVMLSLTDTESESGVQPADTNTTRTSARGILAGLAQEGLKTVTHPAHALDLAGSLSADAQALAKLLFSPADAHTALRGELGVARRVAWTGQMELAAVKAIAHAQGATVNDVLLAAVSGALRRHLQGRGEEPQAIRTFVPFNLRPLDEPIPRELGNRFGLVFLTLPVDIGGRRARLEELKRRMAAIKRSPEGPISYAILEAVGLTPPQLESRIVDIFTAKASAVMTNVPGPREVVYLAGTPVRAVLVWAPTSGSVGMSVSIFSYRGEVTVGLLVDAGLVPDPQRIARHTEQELAALGRLKPVAKALPAKTRPAKARPAGGESPSRGARGRAKGIGI
ncbi:MAG TPA: wax ester/triacylglycerol synthase family O-acyltransferase [Solirubrobacteraceae bacterium]|jgi:WS/DGAT/MGAT family acyltransferase